MSDWTFPPNQQENQDLSWYVSPKQLLRQKNLPYSI